MRVPALRDLTAPWLSEAIGETVTAVRAEAIGTFTTELWRLHVQYGGARSGTLILKRPSPKRPRSFDGFAEEIRFYRELAGELPVRIPRFRWGAVANDGTRAMLILEELPGLESFDWLGGGDDDHMNAALDGLAGVHAAGRNFADGIGWVPTLSDSAERERIEREYAEAWERTREVFETACPGFVPIGDALVNRVAHCLESLASPVTLLHGDPHLENLPRVAGTRSEIAWIDWASVLRGSPGFDVAVLIAMSVPPARRAEKERRWVERHHEALVAAGMGDEPDPWLSYRRGILRRAALIVEIAPRFENPAAALPLVLPRCAQAAVDLDCGSLISTTV